MMKRLAAAGHHKERVFKNYLKNWGQDEIDAISQSIFEEHFFDWKCFSSD